MTDVHSASADRVMVDIETLGTEPGCAVLSIGAVRFDHGDLHDEFYREISLQSCEQAGLTIDAYTLKWWLSQDGEIAEILTGGDELADVLEAFAEFYGDAEEIWANSPAFDCMILSEAYEAVGIVKPWEFYERRDYRTVATLEIVPKREHNGREHHGLDDARHQARVVSDTLWKLEAEMIKA